MTAQRFDSIVRKLTNDWEFGSLLEFYRENAIKESKHLEFCVYLADTGLLDELHNFISTNSLNKLRALADDSENKYEKRENAKILFNIYESEICGVFERHQGSATGIEGNLLNFSQYSDTSTLTNYITKNRDAIFQPDQSPKTLMYLAYAINRTLYRKTDDIFLKLLLDNFDNFKNISSLRKAYITKLITQKLILNNNIVTFPKVGYNELHKILGIIVAQKNKYAGASSLYTLVSDAIRSDLKKQESIQVLGARSKPKVAVCLSGMYRCGNLALESICRNIIEPLDADVFFHSWNEMQDWPGLGGAGDDWILRIFNKNIFNKCPTALRSKKYFKDRFPRTFEVINTSSTSIFNSDKLPSNLEITTIRLEDPVASFKEQGIDESTFSSLGSLNQAKMLYGIYKAHELAVDYEVEKGFRYDYIIRCRPDIGLHNKLNYEAFELLKADEIAMDFTKEYGPQDQFWYGPRPSALLMASLWASSVESGSLSPFPEFPQMRAHGLIFGWMNHNKIQPVHTTIKRDMKMATANAAPPDFSAALAEDFRKEAYELSQNQEVLEFFDALLKFNKS